MVVETRRALAVYRERDLDDEAVLLATSATQAGALKIVSHAWSGRAVDEVKGLVLRLTTEPNVIALLGVTGAKTQFVFARSESVLMGAGSPVGVETLERVLADAQRALSAEVQGRAGFETKRGIPSSHGLSVN